MNPITHGLLGWCGAQRWCRARRDQALVTIAALIPDVDGFGAVIDLATGRVEAPDGWYVTFHRTIGHNVFFAVGSAVALALVARDRLKTGLLALAMIHLHLLCDLVGSKGPDGEIWSFPYFFPLSKYEVGWSGQWELNAWPNMLLTVLLLIVAMRQAWRFGFSPLWFISARADQAFVETLRARFPLPATEPFAEAGIPDDRVPRGNPSVSRPEQCETATPASSIFPPTSGDG
jgi:inner membrane protein